MKPRLRVPARPRLHTTPFHIPFAFAGLLGCLLFLLAAPLASAYDALYAFGDSLTDTGNNPARATNYYNGHFVDPKRGRPIVLNWANPSFVLQSSTNVSGPFARVPGATSPYTNNITPPQLFFRLQGP